MAWEIAIIADPHYDHSGVEMPIWIVGTENHRSATGLRKAPEEMWPPEPICTTFKVSDLNASDANCLAILNPIEEHHPNMTKVHIVGARNSAHVNSRMKEFGLIPFGTPAAESFTDVRPITSLKELPELQLDASNWKSADDIYESLFTAIGAPEWHGRHFDALNDSIVTGSINSVEVPYTISISGMNSANPEVRRLVADLVDFISALRAEGCRSLYESKTTEMEY